MDKAARFCHPNLLQFIGTTVDTYRPPLAIVVTEYVDACKSSMSAGAK